MYCILYTCNCNLSEDIRHHDDASTTPPVKRRLSWVDEPAYSIRDRINAGPSLSLREFLDPLVALSADFNYERSEERHNISRKKNAESHVLFDEFLPWLRKTHSASWSTLYQGNPVWELQVYNEFLRSRLASDAASGPTI